MVVFGGGGGGCVGGVKSRKLSIAARATPAFHTLATAKENTVASISVMQVFITFPLGAKACLQGSEGSIVLARKKGVIMDDTSFTAAT